MEFSGPGRCRCMPHTVGVFFNLLFVLKMGITHGSWNFFSVFLYFINSLVFANMLCLVPSFHVHLIWNALLSMLYPLASSRQRQGELQERRLIFILKLHTEPFPLIFTSQDFIITILRVFELLIIKTLPSSSYTVIC
jgi:hypothetical protein